MERRQTDVLVIGAGIIGIACAYYLKKAAPSLAVALVDRGAPLGFTSAQSGENYRNWWPHPVMKRFTDRSTDLMQEIAGETDNRISLTRRGYVLATRSADLDAILADLKAGYGDDASAIRVHDTAQAPDYANPLEDDWRRVPGGVDVLADPRLIRATFPWLTGDIRTVLHIRRAGHVDGQQLGAAMLERFRESGGTRHTGMVRSIDRGEGFRVGLEGGGEIRCDRLVDAAGPFLGEIAAMLGIDLPVTNVLQQKVAFEDTAGAIDRRMPFTIDLDPLTIDWDADERAALLSDPSTAAYAGEMRGAIHCRPDGGETGRWIKLGWAINDSPSRPTFEPELNPYFPELVLRAAARAQPALRAYYGHLPRAMSHYGGFYTMTEENWPLVGPMSVEGAFVAGAFSGFGTMAACAAGELCAAWVLGEAPTDDAIALSPLRFEDAALMSGLRGGASRGIL